MPDGFVRRRKISEKQTTSTSTRPGQAFRYGKVRICVDVKSQTSLWVCGSGWSVGLVGSFGLADLEGQWVCGYSCKIQGAEGWGGLEREGQET